MIQYLLWVSLAVLAGVLACQRSSPGNTEKKTFPEPIQKMNEGEGNVSYDTSPNSKSSTQAEIAFPETLSEKENEKTASQPREERNNNHYPKQSKPEPIAKRIQKEGGVFISFPDAKDTALFSIMRYLPIRISDSAKIDNIENKNFFSFDLLKLNAVDRKWLLEDVNFEDSAQKSHARIGDMYAYSGAACNANACAIVYHIDILEDYYGKILGQTAVIFVFDKYGKLISKIDSKEFGAFEAILTDDGKYIMVRNGGQFGEGGGQYIQERMRIFEVNSGIKIFETEKLTNHSGISQINNQFYVLQYNSNRGGRVYNVFDPEIKTIFSLDISGDQISMFWELKRDGIHLKDGSILKFNSDFERTTFSSF